MANQERTIVIESILGGHADFTNLSNPDQFQTSVGINPFLPLTDSTSSYNRSLASGLIRPVPTHPIETSVSVNKPLWMIPVEGGNTEGIYIYDYVGSVYSLFGGSLSAVGDLTDGGTAQGNGAGYYDNFVYFARTTTLARYGPLGTSGTSPAFADDYWVATLGKTALDSKSYPLDKGASGQYGMPSHVLKRHSDGKLYIADIVDNRGTLHYVKTSKTTYEGDTDAGSKYDALAFGYNQFISSIESYGSDLAVSLWESESIYQSNVPAKVAFWDTTSDRPHTITTDEFADTFITASKNVNGRLYFFSKNIYQSGFRISLYLGGTSFQTIKEFADGDCPHNGSISVKGDKLYFASSSVKTSGSRAYSVYMLNTTTNAVFSVFPSHYSTTIPITSVAFDNYPSYTGLDRVGIVAGVGTSIFTEGESYASSVTNWTSKLYNTGPFKITKIVIPFPQAIAANMTITPVMYTDYGIGTTYTGGSTNGFPVISNTLFSGKNYIVLRPENMTGNNNFYMTLNFSGSALCTVALPIIIKWAPLDT